jgi:hypothetical protein
MTETTENLTHEILKRIQNELADMRREMREGFADGHVQLAAMGQQLAGLTTAVYGGKSQMQDFKQRIERIERRLELHDQATP